jgi:hypothetical protein
MSGLYDNEAGCYVEADWLADGDWYVDDDNLLYIIPQAGEVAEIEGTDGPMTDTLNALCHDYDPEQPPIAAVEAFGLRYVDIVLRCFTPEEGYYHA